MSIFFLYLSLVNMFCLKKISNTGSYNFLIHRSFKLKLHYFIFLRYLIWTLCCLKDIKIKSPKIWPSVTSRTLATACLQWVSKILYILLVLYHVLYHWRSVLYYIQLDQVIWFLLDVAWWSLCNYVWWSDSIPCRCCLVILVWLRRC